MHCSRLIAFGALCLLACKDGKSSEVATSVVAVEPRRVPAEKIYAASAHVRVVDPVSGTVRGRLDLQRAVSGFAFTRDGRRGFVSASDGVREFDPVNDKWVGRLTDHPTRKVIVDDDAGLLYALEHEVLVKEDGQREILPFRLVSIELATGRVVSEEEIGQRIQFAIPAGAGRPRNVVIGDSGVITVGQSKLAEGVRVGIPDSVKEGGPVRVRGEAALWTGSHVYIPVEATRAWILEIDLVEPTSCWIDLERPLQMRGLAWSGKQKLIYVDAVNELVVLDRARKIPRAAVELPGGHTGIALSKDESWAFLAQTIHEGGGAVTVVDLEKLVVGPQIHIDDISPWAIGVLPR